MNIYRCCKNLTLISIPNIYLNTINAHVDRIIVDMVSAATKISGLRPSAIIIYNFLPTKMSGLRPSANQIAQFPSTTKISGLRPSATKSHNFLLLVRSQGYAPWQSKRSNNEISELCPSAIKMWNVLCKKIKVVRLFKQAPAPGPPKYHLCFQGLHSFLSTHL